MLTTQNGSKALFLIIPCMGYCPNTGIVYGVKKRHLPKQLAKLNARCRLESQISKENTTAPTESIQKYTSTRGLTDTSNIQYSISTDKLATPSTNLVSLMDYKWQIAYYMLVEANRDD